MIHALRYAMMNRPIASLAALASLASALLASPAWAGDVDQPTDEPTSSRAIDRTWLYLDDARVPAPLTAIGMSSLTYTDVGSSPTRIDSPYRQFAANLAQPGAMASLGGEVGLLPRLSVMALGQMGFGGDTGTTGPSAGAIAGLRVQLLPDSMVGTRLVASGGYLHEAWAGPVFNDDTGKWSAALPHGDDGAWFQLAFAQDIRRVRLGATVHGEHVFSDGRDPVDVMVQLGASYRVVGAFRLGAEYVGQDLEESFTPAAEAGARHFVGPTASLQLLQDRLTMVAGPAVGLSAFSPTFIGRFGLAYGF